MCLAIPAEVVSIENGAAHCRVGESETYINVSLMLMDGEVAPGDYLIVHAGFALRKLDQTDAAETLRLLREMVTTVHGGEAGF